MKNIILLLTLGLLSFHANAGLLIEPFYGVALNGSIETENDDADYDSGSTYGARLGWTMMGLQLGVDYRNHLNEFEVNDVDIETASTITYAFIGYEFPVMFRIYAGMGVSSEGTFDNGTNEFDLSEASSTVVGLSYKGLPFIAINFEMVNYDWDTIELDGNDVNDEYSGSHYLVSLSIPINL